MIHSSFSSTHALIELTICFKQKEIVHKIQKRKLLLKALLFAVDCSVFNGCTLCGNDLVEAFRKRVIKLCQKVSRNCCPFNLQGIEHFFLVVKVGSVQLFAHQSPQVFDWVQVRRARWPWHQLHPSVLQKSPTRALTPSLEVEKTLKIHIFLGSKVLCFCLESCSFL